MRGEIAALISILAFALAYIFVNKAQTQGDTSDNGLLPLLVVSTVFLISACFVRWLWVPAEFQITSSWQMSILSSVLSGVSWNFLSRMTLLGSIARIGATRGIIIKSVAPILTVAFAVLFLKEHLSLGDQLGFILMLASIVLLFMEKTKAETRAWFSVVRQGILLGLLSALFQGIGHLLRKMGADVIPPVFGATLDMTAATLTYIVYLIWTGRFQQHAKFYFQHPSFYVLAASVLTALGVLTSFVSIAGASISTVAMILGMQPILMPFLSSLLFPGLEAFTWFSYFAIFLVVCGFLTITVFP